MGSCPFGRLSIYCVFIYYLKVFFPIESDYDIHFLEKSLVKSYVPLNFYLSLFNTEGTKNLNNC